MTAKGNSACDDIRRILKTLAIDLNVSERALNDGMCRNYKILHELLRRNSVEATPSSIAHAFLLLSALTPASSSTLLASMTSSYANAAIVHSLMNLVDTSAIKMLMHNNNEAADDGVVSERLKEVSQFRAYFSITSLICIH
jgi:hypothetical protein